MGQLIRRFDIPWMALSRQQTGLRGLGPETSCSLVIDEARSLIRQRNEIEAQADELLRHSQDYQLLRQIPGIGPINASTVIAEAGDLRRFGHHRQFLKFCGLDLSTWLAA